MCFFCSVPAVLPASQHVKDDLSRVYHQLMDSYDREVRPTVNGGRKDPLEVKFGVAAICFDLTADGILKGETWLRWVWNDERLKMNTDVSSIKVNPSKLWRPDITLYNR